MHNCRGNQELSARTQTLDCCSQTTCCLQQLLSIPTCPCVSVYATWPGPEGSLMSSSGCAGVLLAGGGVTVMVWAGGNRHSIVQALVASTNSASAPEQHIKAGHMWMRLLSTRGLCCTSAGGDVYIHVLRSPVIVVVNTILAWTVCSMTATRHCCKQVPHKHCWVGSVVVLRPCLASQWLPVCAQEGCCCRPARQSPTRYKLPVTNTWSCASGCAAAACCSQDRTSAMQLTTAALLVVRSC